MESTSGFESWEMVDDGRRKKLNQRGAGDGTGKDVGRRVIRGLSLVVGELSESGRPVEQVERVERVGSSLSRQMRPVMRRHLDTSNNVCRPQNEQ